MCAVTRRPLRSAVVLLVGLRPLLMRGAASKVARTDKPRGGAASSLVAPGYACAFEAASELR